MNLSRSLLLKNANLYSPEIIKGRKDILVIDGKIVKIAGKIKNNFGLDTLDCSGKIVAPGFIDVHAQGAGGMHLLEDTRNALAVISLTLAGTGVTSFLSTTVALSGKKQEHLGIIGEAVRNGLPGAETLGSHLEGPFINSKKKGMIRQDTIKKPSKVLLDSLIKASGSTIRMMTVAPELKGNLQLIGYMKNKNIIPALGHTYATYEESLKGIKAGITHATHFFNAMSPLTQRDPGAPGAVFDSPGVSAQVISDGKHLVPAVLRMIYKLLSPERICLITDSMPSLGLTDGRYEYFGRKYTSINGTCYYADGTLIGTAVPMNEMGRRFRKFTGASLSEVFTMLALSPALALGVKKGRIKIGYDADLVVTDAKLNIYASIVRGSKVYCRLK